MKFRTDISFLRALSVVIVMLFHFQIPGFRGGFVGVDVFFVISGYLMTRIVLKSFENNSFSLLEFYKKRIIRILPPLHLMLWFVLIVSIVLFFDAQIKLNAKFTVLSSLFLSNIYYWKYIDYFTSKDNILLHTWSLGVEWQFYLIYPLLLLLLRKIYKTNVRAFIGLILLFTIISFTTMLFFTTRDNNFAFYMLPTRFWELSLGACGIFASDYIKIPNKLKYLFVIIAVSIIIACIIFLSEAVRWPSIFTLLPSLATIVILSLKVENPIFSNKIVKFLGDISYSLYLWHWPLFVVFQNFGLLNRYIYIIILIILSIVLSTISYYGVEKSAKVCRIKWIIISSILIIIVSSTLFFAPNFLRYFSLYNNSKYEIANYSNTYLEKSKNAQFNPLGCYLSAIKDINNFKPEFCLKIDNTKPNIILIGDSHMAQFSSSLRKYKEYNWLELSTGYVLPVIRNNGELRKKLMQDNVFKDFVISRKTSLVLISAHWLMRHNAEINFSQEELIDAIKETVDKFETNGVNYMFIGQTETYTLPYPKIVMLRQFGRHEKEFVNVESKEINELLKTIIPKDKYIDIFDSAKINRENQKELYMFDNNHLTNFGTDQYVGEIIIPRIKLKLIH